MGVLRGTRAVARAAFRETTRDPAFLVLLAAAGLLIFLSQFFTFFTFRAAGKTMMLQDMGVATLTLACLLFAVFSAAAGVSRELEERTALTALAKPLSRRSFVAGKFLGLLGAAFLLLLGLAGVLGVTLWLDHVLSVREVNFAGFFRPGAALEFLAGLPLFGPQLLFAFLETAIFCALAVALALFLPFAGNLIACLLLFAAGNIASWLIHAARDLPAAAFALQVVFAILPCFDIFRLDEYHGPGEAPDLATVALGAAYGLLYSGFVLFAAGALFEKRELD